jgi:hypothetical protein
MASPALPTATTASCPQCLGYGEERAVGTRGGSPVILTTTCGLCGGDGRLPTVGVNAPAIAPTEDPPAPLELWPFLIPLGLFLLFFLFLWL